MNGLVGLLDTNILVDFSRKYQSAIEWLESNKQQLFAVPSLVQMEMILGTSNKADQLKITKLLRPYTIVYPNEADAEWAMQQFEMFHLSHQVEIIDCFIAAMSVRLQLPVYTRNAKDLGVFPGVQLHIPY